MTDFTFKVSPANTEDRIFEEDGLTGAKILDVFNGEQTVGFVVLVKDTKSEYHNQLVLTVYPNALALRDSIQGLSEDEATARIKPGLYTLNIAEIVTTLLAQSGDTETRGAVLSYEENNPLAALFS